MAYSLNLITVLTQLTALKTATEKEIRVIDYQQTGIEMKKDTYVTTGAEIDVEMATLDTEIKALASVLATLPAGDAKDFNTAKFKKAEYAYFVASERDKKYGSVALVDKELDMAKNVQLLIVLKDFVAAIDARIAALG